MNDGAAALVVSSRQYAEKHSHQPIARVVGYGEPASDAHGVASGVFETHAAPQIFGDVHFEMCRELVARLVVAEP